MSAGNSKFLAGGTGISPQPCAWLRGTDGCEILSVKILGLFFHPVIDPTKCNRASARFSHDVLNPKRKRHGKISSRLCV
jgi:hypothetical protein